MPYIALFVAVIALLVFGWETWKTKRLIALGLSLLTAAWILSLTVGGKAFHF